jgi:histidinol phosphatase-like PHP family hydrolase
VVWAPKEEIVAALFAVTGCRIAGAAPTPVRWACSTSRRAVQAAAARGYAYYAITDHTPNLYMQRMSYEKMGAQRARVRELDRKHRGMRLVHGTELNIDGDGGVN